MTSRKLAVGTASWTIPKEAAVHFPVDGTHLQRYAQVLNAVEINSSFYKEHKPATYKKWSDSVPEDFRFSVKLSKVFTHTQKLLINAAEVHAVLTGIKELGSKWEVLLVQLPPSLAFHDSTAFRFFEILRQEFTGMIAFEPRHKTWAEAKALDLYNEFKIVKVFADPEPCPLPSDSGNIDSKNDLNHRYGSYFRLHGTPEIYKSNYDSQTLKNVYEKLASNTPTNRSAWCIFDNTTFGYATLNALELKGLADNQQKSFKKTANVIHSVHA